MSAPTPETPCAAIVGWRVDWDGSRDGPGYYKARTRNRARMMTARALVDLGYYRRVIDALLSLRVRRAPTHDVAPALYGKDEGPIAVGWRP